MITLKDKIDQFKRDCRSNDYYTKMIIDCNERLEEIAENMSDCQLYKQAGNSIVVNVLEAIFNQFY